MPTTRSAVETLAPVEVLATRVPLIFAKCGPIYSYLVCIEPKKSTHDRRNIYYATRNEGDKFHVYTCTGCDFKSLVRLLSSSRAMQEARKSCTFSITTRGLWCNRFDTRNIELQILDNTTMGGVRQYILKMSDEIEKRRKRTVRVGREVTREMMPPIAYRLVMSIVCPYCARDTHWNEETLLRSLPKRPCTVSHFDGGACFWEVWFGISPEIYKQQECAMAVIRSEAYANGEYGDYYGDDDY